MFFFGVLSMLLCVISLSLGIPVILDFVDTGLVERVPTAILSSSIALIAVMSFFLRFDTRHVCHVAGER